MTAQVAILNKNAVAMASDSAITIRNKIYTSDFKLHRLSEKVPVGIMFNNSPRISGVPTDVLVKSYRKELGDSRFFTLREYVNDFINYLDGSRKIFSNFEQGRDFAGHINTHFKFIKKSVENYFKKKKNQISKEKLLSRELDSGKKKWEKANDLLNLPANYHDVLLEKYTNKIEENIKKVFGGYNLSQKQLDTLRLLALYTFSKDIFLPTGTTEAVVAGYGEDDYFPSLISVRIQGVVADKLKCKIGVQKQIGPDTHGSIMPFAQRNTVSSFINGIHPRFEQNLYRYFKKLSRSISKKIASTDLLKQTDEKTKKKHLKEIDSFLDLALDKLKKDMANYKKDKHWGTLLDAVQYLPSAELANMAEALVNLTSFRLRVSMEDETVGGPIDVAVISKGDGFVWVKKKSLYNNERISNLDG